MDALNCVTALQDEAFPSIIDQLNYQSSPGCWLPWPHSKNHVTALQAQGYPSIMDQLNYPQLFRLLALLAILEKPCHSSPGCWLSWPYSKNHVTVHQATGSPGHTQKTMS